MSIDDFQALIHMHWRKPFKVEQPLSGEELDLLRQAEVLYLRDTPLGARPGESCTDLGRYLKVIMNLLSESEAFPRVTTIRFSPGIPYESSCSRQDLVHFLDLFPQLEAIENVPPFTLFILGDLNELVHVSRVSLSLGIGNHFSYFPEDFGRWCNRLTLKNPDRQVEIDVPAWDPREKGGLIQWGSYKNFPQQLKKLHGAVHISVTVRLQEALEFREGLTLQDRSWITKFHLDHCFVLIENGKPGQTLDLRFLPQETCLFVCPCNS